MTAPDPIPFFQIVHVSDLHFLDAHSFTVWPAKHFALQLTRRFRPSLHRMIVEGTAGHDKDAPDLFADFLDEITIRSPEPEWSSVPTCIVDSGDLTTFGDKGSFSLGFWYLSRFGAGRHLIQIHGNHDAWPESFPLAANTLTVEAQTSFLRNSYTVNLPSAPLSFPIPHRRGEVQLYTLDSVIHDNRLNTFAFGFVDAGQMDRLGALIDNASPHGKHNLRILIVHHPVHFPPPCPNHEMRMINSHWIGRTLNSATLGGAYPMTHLVLSGHTHEAFPDMGSLPATARACIHPQLGTDQCQLVVGSLMQVDTFGSRGLWPHQCQILRFYYSPSDERVLYVNRLFAGRTGGTGPYMFVPDPSGPAPLEEEIKFEI
jgi:3',5'-cyclic AMP phosphodiesterase CpdA